MNLPYDREYTLFLETHTGSTIEGTVNPRRDSTYTKEIWDKLTTAEKQQWLNEFVRDWALQYLEYSWSF